jgi:hypothetical protein
VQWAATGLGNRAGTLDAVVGTADGRRTFRGKTNVPRKRRGIELQAKSAGNGGFLTIEKNLGILPN